MCFIMRNDSLLSVLFLLIILSKSSRAQESSMEVFGELIPSLNELNQEDPRLIELLRDKYIVRPPSSSTPYNLSFPPDKYPMEYLRGQHSQPIIVNNILKNKKKGFFIEAGAADGQMLSNTLLFELLHQWTGLLVEPNPDFYANLSTRNRRAHTIPHCLSTKKTPEIVFFDASGLVGGIVVPDRIKPGDIDREGDTHRLYHRRTIKVQCFPLYSILMALGNPRVDYFSLDIEGAEIPVLQSIPWDKVDIGIVDIEVNHLGKVFDGNVTELMKFMDSVGYQHIHTANIDFLFRKKSDMKKKKKKKTLKAKSRPSEEL